MLFYSYDICFQFSNGKIFDRKVIKKHNTVLASEILTPDEYNLGV